jgi:hypothetical protein
MVSRAELARRPDLAVAAVMAHSRAVELARRPAPSIYVGCDSRSRRDALPGVGRTLLL